MVYRSLTEAQRIWAERDRARVRLAMAASDPERDAVPPKALGACVDYRPRSDPLRDALRDAINLVCVTS